MADHRRVEQTDIGEGLRLIIIGKTGNGKSTLGNILLGRQHFSTGCSMASTTLKLSPGSSALHRRHLKVFDTPDISNMGLSEDEAQHEVARWKAMTSPDVHAILLAVRCDVRYTREEHQIFLLLKKLWGGNSLCKRLVVTFTFGDHQDCDIREELKTVCAELQSVLRDAGGRYVVFSDKASDEEKKRTVLQLCQLVDKMDKELIQKEENELLLGFQVCPCSPHCVRPVNPRRMKSMEVTPEQRRGEIVRQQSLPQEPSKGKNPRSASHAEPLRMILLGRSRTGKSSTGNTILGREAFPVSEEPHGTREAAFRSGMLNGAAGQVIDTPGLPSQSSVNAESGQQWNQAIILCSPGPHVVLFVVRVSDVTNDDLAAYRNLMLVFGERIRDNTILVLVGSGQNGNAGVAQGQALGTSAADPAVVQVTDDEGSHVENPALSSLLRESGWKTWAVDNSGQDFGLRQQQTTHLMQTVQLIQAETEGRPLDVERFRRSDDADKASKTFQICSLL